MIIVAADTISPVLWIGILIIILGAVYCFYMYYKSKISLITIQYAGGEIGFDQRWFTYQEIEQFQKQLRIAKDKAIEESENSVANKMEQAIMSISSQTTEYKSVSKLDELTKLGDLLEKGIITKDEFENMKKDLI